MTLNNSGIWFCRKKKTLHPFLIGISPRKMTFSHPFLFFLIIFWNGMIKETSFENFQSIIDFSFIISLLEILKKEFLLSDIH